MSVIVNLAAERARRSIDSVLDRIKGIRRELDPLACTPISFHRWSRMPER
jgi:hypothetical protein